MITVVKAKSQLPGGAVLSAPDLVLDPVVASDVPDGVLTDPGELIGKTLAAPVAENQMMTLLTTTAARASTGFRARCTSIRRSSTTKVTDARSAP